MTSRPAQHHYRSGWTFCLIDFEFATIFRNQSDMNPTRFSCINAKSAREKIFRKKTAALKWSAARTSAGAQNNEILFWASNSMRGKFPAGKIRRASWKK